MKAAIICLCFALASCALPVSYEPIVPAPGQRNGDITVRAPNQRHERDERAAASAHCAQYGRVERQSGGRDYECVSPADAAGASSH